MTIPITNRATPVLGTRLSNVPSHGVAFVQHELPMPVAACPVSRNPLSGTVRIRYRPRTVVVEVVSLHDELLHLCSNKEGTPRSVEELASVLAYYVVMATGAPSVTVELDLLVNPGPQRMIVRCRK